MLLQWTAHIRMVFHYLIFLWSEKQKGSAEREIERKVERSERLLHGAFRDVCLNFACSNRIEYVLLKKKTIKVR